MLTPDDPRWEADEIEVALRAIMPTSRVLEAGAGSGKTTAALADVAQLVVALEPNREQAQIAQARAPRAIVLPLALWIESGPVILAVRDEWWNSGLIDGQPFGTVVEERPVEAVTLGGIVTAFSLDTLILDVEGAEHWLLAGVPREIRTVVAEVHPFIDEPDRLRWVVGQQGFELRETRESGPNTVAWWQR